jgi:hypothetical protein
MKPARARAQTPAPGSPWILDGGGGAAAADLGLLVAAPLWIVPLLYGLGALAGDRAVNDWVLSLGAIGHHLPGMLRAYGDRALWRRFRARFVLAPVGLGALCVAVADAGLQAIVLIAFVWGVWHGMMQTYGFARIYGAKAGATDRLGARLDLALCATWFTAGVIASPLRLTFLLDELQRCGLPLPSPGGLAVLRYAVGAATATATIAWIAAEARRVRAGGRPALARLGLLGASIAFWCFANVRIRHPLLGMPLFELLHDVQYLALVWLFNRRRAAATPGELGPLLRAMFRPGRGALAVYVVAVAAYGAVARWHPAGATGDALSGLVAASQLLHFYYDGFIWKVREPATAAPLGVTSSTMTAAAVAPGRLRHAALWALLLVPCALLVVGERATSLPLEERILGLAALVPDSAVTRFAAAEIQWKRGAREDALDGLRHVLAIDPDYQPARNNLALSLGELADAAAAAGDTASLGARLEEMRALRPGLVGPEASFVDERLARYGAR